MSLGLLRSRCLVLGRSILKQNHDIFVRNQIRRHKFPDIYNIQCKYSTDNKSKQANDLEVIYDGILSKQIRLVKTFSLTTTIMGLFGQPLIYSKSLEVGGAPVMIVACSIVGFFTFVTPVLLHLITRKYVMKLEYDRSDDTYLATLMTFFVMRYKVKFSCDDVEVPDVPGMFTTFHAKNIPMFVDFKAFKNPEHIARIMGYDKPMDFKLYDETNKKE